MNTFGFNGNGGLNSTVDNHETRLQELETAYIGVSWNETQDTYERLGNAVGKTDTQLRDYFPFNQIKKCNLNDDGYVEAYYGEPLYTTDGSNGQVMTQFPKTYYKYEYDDSTGDAIHTWKFSEFQLEGFEPHWNFIKGNAVKDYAYLGTFEGSIYDTSASAYLLADEQVADFTSGTGDLLCSIAGAKPCSGETQSLHINNARILANNRGDGWGLQDGAMVSYLHVLMVIMYASLNSQTNVGRGVVDLASGTGNESLVTGQLADEMYGTATGTDGEVPIIFAGVENFWGNIWKFTDGINIEADNKLYINVANTNFASDKFTDEYVYQGDLLNANGYPGSMLPIKYGFYPDASGGSTSAGFTDYYYQTTGNRIARLGGHWIAGSTAGALSWALDGSSGASGRTFCARLLYR